MRSPSPTLSSSSRARAVPELTSPPAAHAAAERFPPRSAWGSIDRIWNTNPILRPRTTASSSSLKPVMSVPSSTMLPDVGVSRPASRSEQRALAAAGRSHDRHELPRRHLQIDAAQNLHAMRAGIDDLGEVARFENRHLLLLCWQQMRYSFVSSPSRSRLCACSSPAQNRLTNRRQLPRPMAPLRRRPPRPRKVLVVFGDSLSAGLRARARPEFSRRSAKEARRAAATPWRVVNLGISGDTTEGGVSRMDSATSLQPAS